MTLDLKLIKKQGLTIRQYMMLQFFYFQKSGENKDYVQQYGRVPLTEANELALKGWLKINSFMGEDGKVAKKVELRDKARKLFEGDEDYFLKWFNLFPLKTGDRYLRPKDDDTIKGRALRKKWNKHFKGNADKAKRAIQVLEAEKEWRRRNGKFQFMNNAETWLNQGKWEEYADLLDSKDTQIARLKDDYR